MDENLFDKYLEKLNTQLKSPHVIITGLYCEIFGKQPNKNMWSTFGRLVKLYGVRIVFSAVCDVAGYSEVDERGNLLPLIASITKKRFEESNNKPKLNYFDFEKREKFLESFKEDNT